MGSIRGLKERVERVLDELSELDMSDFARTESEVRKRFLELAGKALERMCADSGKGYAGTRRRCACGQHARYEGDRQRTVVTICGPIRLKRAYYRCVSCRRSEYPLDGQLDLRAGWSPGVRDLVALAGASWSYARAADFVRRTTGVSISATAAETLAEREGQRAMAVMEQGGPSNRTSQSGRTGVYLDGVMTPLRGRWAETKVGAVRGADGAKRYVAYLGGPAPVGRMVRRAAASVGARRTREVVVIGDGAPWIWKQAAVNFPGAIEVVDWYHGCQYIHETALKLYGEGSAKGHAWSARKRDVLWKKGACGLLTSLGRGRYREREPVKELARYVRNNLHRMDYPRFRRIGVDIGSGPVESACKQVVQARLKQAGMRWTPNDAQKIMALRCIYLSGLWDHFWSRAA